MRPDGTDLTRLTDDDARDWYPMFTPDSQAVTFQSNKGGGAYAGWSIRLDGSNRRRLTDTSDGDGDTNTPVFSPDGRQVMFAVGNVKYSIIVGPAPGPVSRATGRVIAAPIVGDGQFYPFDWSGDGRWWIGSINLPSGKLGGNAVYEVATGVVRQLSDDNVGWVFGFMPDWRRVVYFTKSGRLMIQDLDTLKRREIAMPPILVSESFQGVTVSPDGRTLYYGAQQSEANIWKVEQPTPGKK